MNARLLALAAGLPFALGVAVGAGAGPIDVATAAQPEAVAPVSGMPMEGMNGMTAEAMTSMHADRDAMDAMHAAMADQMPAELREDCDAMHAAMADGDMPMGDVPMGDVPMRGDMPAGMPGDHAAHHR